MRVVVHPAQQHALVEQRDARLTQHGHRRAKLTVNFIRVIDVVNQITCSDERWKRLASVSVMRAGITIGRRL